MKLFVVTGPDGAGKSTVCALARAALCSEYGEGSAVQASVWDALGDSKLFASREDVVSYLGSLNGFTRTLFIYHALSRALDVAREKNPKIILVEGYWYKYAITEIGQGVPSQVVLSAAQGFETPDAVVSIDIDPETAWTRKKSASQYEQGVGTSGLSSERFQKFQQALAPLWLEFEEKFGPWTHISALKPPSAVADELVQICRKGLSL